MQLCQDDLTDPRVIALLRDHLANMREISPPESVHALDIEGLRSPEITFWSAWNGPELIGCGALKELAEGGGEIKSMRTVAAHRGTGVGSKILRHIIEEAERRGYQRLLLETGAQPEFTPAHTLYLRHGFEFCGPFGEYTADPNSVFMARRVAVSGPRTPEK